MIYILSKLFIGQNGNTIGYEHSYVGIVEDDEPLSPLAHPLGGVGLQSLVLFLRKPIFKSF